MPKFEIIQEKRPVQELVTHFENYLMEELTVTLLLTFPNEDPPYLRSRRTYRPMTRHTPFALSLHREAYQALITQFCEDIFS